MYKISDQRPFWDWMQKPWLQLTQHKFNQAMFLLLLPGKRLMKDGDNLTG